MKNKIETNENVILEIKLHWCVLIIPAIISLFFTMGSIMGLIDNSKDWTFYIVFLIISLLIFVIPFLRFKTSKLILTDKRIYGRVGIIKTKTLSSPISKIQTVNVNKSVLGRIFGYSNLVIHCITGVYEFKTVKNAQDMQNAIINVIK